MSRPLRLLLLTYYCPPAGGPGVQRLEMLLRHLPPEVEATVVTAAVEDYQVLSPLRMPLDDSRFQTAHPVHRVPSGLPGGAFRALARCRLYGLVRWLYVPDVARRWARRAVAEAGRLHAESPFDVIFSTAPPFSAALAGRDAARQLGLPWVCDLRDLWTRLLYGSWPSRFHHEREQELERSVLQEATATVLVTPGSRETILRQYPALDPDSVVCVTNGFCSSDYPPRAPAGSGKLVIVHTGSFLASQAAESRLRRRVTGRAFLARRVDHSTHSPALLIQAMERLQDPRIEFRHIGPLDGDTCRWMEASPLRSQLQAPGYRPHNEMLAELARADAAYLSLPTVAGEPWNEHVPLKTYEYLGARLPVLAPIQDGDAKNFLLASGLGICTPPRDSAALAAALGRLADAKFENRPLAVPCEDFLRGFEWRGLAERLLNVLDRAAFGSRPLVSSAV